MMTFLRSWSDSRKWVIARDRRSEYYKPSVEPSLKASHLDLCDTVQGNRVHYTGMDDKNGKAIREGDIVETLIGGKRFRTVIEWYAGWIGINGHEYGTPYCGWIADFRGDLDDCGLSGEVAGIGTGLGEIEVIGNIYSDPELIPEHFKTSVTEVENG